VVLLQEFVGEILAQLIQMNLLAEKKENHVKLENIVKKEEKLVNIDAENKEEERVMEEV
jgi:hypothetical protein